LWQIIRRKKRRAFGGDSREGKLAVGPAAGCGAATVGTTPTITSPVRLDTLSPVGDTTIEQHRHAIGRGEHGAERVVLGAHPSPDNQNELAGGLVTPMRHPLAERVKDSTHEPLKSKRVAIRQTPAEVSR
jgi:hypothetical protein